MRGSTLAVGCLLALAACAADAGSGARTPGDDAGSASATAEGPLLGASHVLVPDPAGEGVLLVSGPPEGTAGGEIVLARWDGSTWHEVETGDDAPEARSFFAAAHDPDLGLVVVHGGQTADGTSGETWVWDGGAWEQVTGDGPGPRSAASMAWDPASGTTVLHGGNDDAGLIRNDTWAFDGEAWARVATRGPTPVRWWAAMTAVGDGSLVAYGGHQVADEDLPPALGDTWLWRDGSWRQVPRAGGPGVLVNALGLLHPELGPLLLGGSDLEGENGDVWRWTGDRWARLARDVLPARQAFGAAYDEERDVVVLTGGVVEPGQIVRHQDVWEWSGDPAEPAELVAERPPA